MAIKKVKCNLCGGIKHQQFLEKNGNSIIKCQNCGFLFVNPQPTQNQLNKLYQKQYFQADPSQKNIVSYWDYIGDKPIYARYFAKKLDEIKDYKRKGKILDIGCAIGFFLEMAKKADFDTFGIDISKFAVDYAKKKLNLNVYHGQLEERRFPSNTFDVVTLFQVIEHVKNPLNLLKEIKRILKPKGLLMLVTPDSDCLQAKIFGRYWWGYTYKTHLFIFNPKTITSLLQKAGFTNMKVKKEYSVYLSVEDILTRIRDRYSWQFVNRLINIFPLFGKISDWKFAPLSLGMSVEAIG